MTSAERITLRLKARFSPITRSASQSRPSFEGQSIRPENVVHPKRDARLKGIPSLLPTDTRSVIERLSSSRMPMRILIFEKPAPIPTKESK